MHGSYLGIAEAICSLWFDSENHGEEYYVKAPEVLEYKNLLQ